MTTWFTADCHFGHKNILGYCNRPFKNIGEMDYRLVQLWNSRVKDEDLEVLCKVCNSWHYLTKLKGLRNHWIIKWSG